MSVPDIDEIRVQCPNGHSYTQPNDGSTHPCPYCPSQYDVATSGTTYTAHIPQTQPREIQKARPSPIVKSLQEAMRREGVPIAWFPDLLYIMMAESSGLVGAKNRKGSSATGLFQLLKDNWHYMPRGEQSIGDAVDEAIGGIRYIKARYGDAAKARKFWEENQWY